MFSDLNESQEAAATYSHGPLLVLAGAGTGKTKTLAARVAHLITSGVRPERILLLTFSRRAATEMLDRVAAVTDRRAASQVWGGTFHAVANRLLRQYGSAVGFDPGFTVLDQSDTEDLLGLVRAELGHAERGSRFPKKETVAGVYSRMVNAQQRLDDVLVHQYPWCREHGDAFREMFTAYTRRKRAHQVVDYDDLLLLWRALAVSPTVGSVVCSRFDHVLVDEFQDTNAMQLDILRAHGGSAIPTVVGDDAQAIYGFRAADHTNVRRFGELWPTARTIALEQNYRSVQPILDLANAVLEQSDAHLPKTLVATRGMGARPRLVQCHDEAAQSAFVADAVLELREQGIDLREQAVLYRANHHADMLELELTARDIPFVKYGGLKFLEAAHVKDLLALVRVLDNPHDELAWRRVLGLVEGVGPATVARLVTELGVGARGGPRSPLAVLVDDPPSIPSAAATDMTELRAAFGALLDADRTASGTDPARDVECLLPFCRKVIERKYHDAAARLADLDQMHLAASRHASRDSFLADLTLDPPERTGDLADEPMLDDDWLTLSTIHSAKGLEWRAVHIIHAADGNLPSDMALADNDGIEEERRLLYVALTRARDSLTVTYPLRYHIPRRGRDDRHNLAPLSRFLEPVREQFDQHATGPVRPGLDPRIDARVTITDEVDTLLEGLWG
jgi:DNA helicase-2/ATP-dependent DNA helicase PcrA